MWLSNLRSGDWQSLRLTSVGLSVAMLVLAWGVTLHRLESDKAMAVSVARAQQTNLAVVVSEHLAQLLDNARLIAIASHEWWVGSTQDVAKRLNAMRSANPAFLRISLYDAGGSRVYSSSHAEDDPAWLAGVQAALRHQSDSPSRGRMLVEATNLPEEAWHRPLLFPVGRPGKESLGVLMVMLDLGYLLNLYRNIDFAESGSIRILGQDADEMLEWRPEGLVLKSASERFPQFSNLATPTGSVVMDQFDEGNLYLSSYSRPERFPFVVVVSRSMEDILTLHQQTKSQSMAILAILTIIIAASTYLVARSIRRQEKLFGALVTSNKENRALIDRLEDERGRAFKLAAHDHLTGLLNRLTFNESAMNHLANAKRHRHHYALMYLDLDRFKVVNDTLGHHVGDGLLQEVATRLRASLRESDLVARLGGDEFAVLLTGVSSIDHLRVVANKLIEQVGRSFYCPDGHEIKVSPSIGIAVYPRDGKDFDTLCKNADAAMYESKRKGRCTFTFYDAALNPSDARSFNLEQRLPRAIRGNELVLHFQPRVRLSDFKIVGFEALVRWQHPEFGLVYPGDFIPMAEETGLIVELGEWVLRSCCRQQAAWRAEGLGVVPVSINMSAVELQREELPQQVEQVLTEYGVSADMLDFEITETVLLDSIDTAGMVLRRLETLGARISLDDFGSGFSSLGYIRTLPIHTIKIDKQFINDIRNSPHDAVLTVSIISLAHNLGMQVVAEGVETVEQLIHLKTAGCDEAQGYYFSRPVPAAAARDLLRELAIAPEMESA